MAMRLFSAAEFKAELERMGLKPTDIETDTSVIWHTPNGKPQAVPKLALDRGCPEFVLDELLRQVNLLYRPWDRPQQAADDKPDTGQRRRKSD